MVRLVSDLREEITLLDDSKLSAYFQLKQRLRLHRRRDDRGVWPGARAGRALRREEE